MPAKASQGRTSRRGIATGRTAWTKMSVRIFGLKGYSASRNGARLFQPRRRQPSRQRSRCQTHVVRVQHIWDGKQSPWPGAWRCSTGRRRRRRRAAICHCDTPARKPQNACRLVGRAHSTQPLRSGRLRGLSYGPRPAAGGREAPGQGCARRRAQDYCRGAGCGSCPTKIFSNSGLSNGASAVSASANAKFAARNPSFAPQS